MLLYIKRFFSVYRGPNWQILLVASCASSGTRDDRALITLNATKKQSRDHCLVAARINDSEKDLLICPKILRNRFFKYLRDFLIPEVTTTFI